jgi:hypothetical protein
MMSPWMRWWSRTLSRPGECVHARAAECCGCTGSDTAETKPAQVSRAGCGVCCQAPACPIDGAMALGPGCAARPSAVCKLVNECLLECAESKEPVLPSWPACHGVLVRAEVPVAMHTCTAYNDGLLTQQAVRCL